MSEKAKQIKKKKLSSKDKTNNNDKIKKTGNNESLKKHSTPKETALKTENKVNGNKAKKDKKQKKRTRKEENNNIPNKKVKENEEEITDNSNNKKKFQESDIDDIFNQLKTYKKEKEKEKLLKDKLKKEKLKEENKDSKRKMTEDGLPIYTLEELGYGRGGGGLLHYKFMPKININILFRY